MASPSSGPPQSIQFGDMSPLDRHEANDHYVLRLPSQSWPEFTTVTALWSALPNDFSINPTTPYPFIQQVDWQAWLHPKVSHVGEWSYKSRWQAQQILPFLYLGPSAVFKDADFLQTAGITMVVNIRQVVSKEEKMLSPFLQRARESGIHVLPLNVHSAQDLVGSLSAAIADVNGHLSSTSQSTVLICCESGSTRSAAFVVAYCMETLGIQLHLAIKLVHTRRFCVAFDDPLRTVLISYSDLLQARRDVFDGTPSESAPLPQRAVNKRSRLAEDDGDADMQLEDDIARFEHRTFVPFQG